MSARRSETGADALSVRAFLRGLIPNDPRSSRSTVAQANPGDPPLCFEL